MSDPIDDPALQRADGPATRHGSPGERGSTFPGSSSPSPPAVRTEDRGSSGQKCGTIEVAVDLIRAGRDEA